MKMKINKIEHKTSCKEDENFLFILTEECEICLAFNLYKKASNKNRRQLLRGGKGSG